LNLFAASEGSSPRSEIIDRDLDPGCGVEDFFVAISSSSPQLQLLCRNLGFLAAILPKSRPLRVLCSARKSFTATFQARGGRMSVKLSVEEVLAQLEKREAFHRDQEVFHAEQDVFHGEQQVHHREQQAVHAAELEKVRQSLAAFRAAAASAVDLVGPLEPSPPAPAGPKLPPPGRKFVSGLLQQVVADLQEPFSPTTVAAEANRRFKAHLREPVTARTVSDVLRRLVKEGELQLVRKGKAHHEASYRRRGRGGEWLGVSPAWQSKAGNMTLKGSSRRRKKAEDLIKDHKKD
jgi:hypothetical protein